MTPVGPSTCWTLVFRATSGSRSPATSGNRSPATSGNRSPATSGSRSSAGQLRVAVIVKATFIFVPDRAMLLVEPDAIVAADRRHLRAPESSLLAASDLVPWRPRADVTLRGHAKAPQGQATTVMGVRFMVARGEGMVLDKRLVIQGPPGPLGPAGGPTPITSIPLVYENAAGGPGCLENPVGVPEGSGRWPTILDANRQPRPVGFGPISAAWAIRGRLWHAPHDPRGAGIPEFPPDFEWEYFNAAPPDQRLPYLHGDEWVGFEGMNSQIPRVQSCLPHAQGVARLYGPEPETRGGKPIPLVADTLTVDTDQLRCWVVWRGAFTVENEAELDGLHVVAGVETPERRVVFPAAYSAAASATPVVSPAPAPVSARASRRAAQRELAETQSASSTPESGERRPVMPFGPFGSAPRDVRQSPPRDVRQSPPRDVRQSLPRKKPDKRLLAMRVFDPGAAAQVSTTAAPAARPAEETIEPVSAVAPPIPFAQSAPPTPFTQKAPPSVFSRTAEVTSPITPAPATPFEHPPAAATPAKRARPGRGATLALDASAFVQPPEAVLPFAGGGHSGHPAIAPAHATPEELASLPPATPFDHASGLAREAVRPSFSPPAPLLHASALEPPCLVLQEGAYSCTAFMTYWRVMHGMHDPAPRRRALPRTRRHPGTNRRARSIAGTCAPGPSARGRDDPARRPSRGRASCGQKERVHARRS